ncbi:MAG: tetratricopeptide repeat protein [Candidatus Marinimicrobia bacterium]|nr:tetratricopeptide repeat protein [Candidatus Neomarinimicrobiota bacterium]
MSKKSRKYYVFVLLFLVSCASRELIPETPAPQPEKYPTQGILHFMYGEIYRSTGNIGYANMEYRRALEYDTTTTILNAIGESYLLLGKHLLATEYFEKALALEPGDPTAGSRVAELYMRESRYEEAIPLLERQFEGDPDDPGLMRNLAECYRRSGRYQDALALLDRMILLEPDIAWSYIYAAETLFENGRIREVPPYLEKAVTLIPPNNDLYEFWVRSLFENKDYPGMLRALESWLESRPEMLAPYFLYIDYQFQFGNFQKADDALAMIKPRWKESGRIPYFQGMSAMARNEADSVWYYFERSEAFPEDNADLYMHYGLWFWEKGDRETAEKIADRAILRQGPESRWLHMKAMIRAQSGDFLAAEGLLKDLLANDPGNLSAKEDLANIYIETERPAQADSVYAEILREAPGNSSILNNYAYALAQMDLRLADALRMADKALKNEKNAAYCDTKAWILFRQKKFAQALKWVEKALSYPDVSSDVYYHKGRILAEMKRPDEARKAYERSLELDPGNPIVKKALEELK